MKGPDGSDTSNNAEYIKRMNREHYRKISEKIAVDVARKCGYHVSIRGLESDDRGEIGLLLTTMEMEIEKMLETEMEAVLKPKSFGGKTFIFPSVEEQDLDEKIEKHKKQLERDRNG